MSLAGAAQIWGESVGWSWGLRSAGISSYENGDLWGGQSGRGLLELSRQWP